VASGGPGLERPLDLKGPGVIRGIAFSGDGTRLAVGTQTGEVAVSAWPAGRTLRRFAAPSAVTVVAFSPDGRALACVGNGPNPALRVCDLVSGETRTFHGHKGDCTSVAFHPTGRLLATGATDGTVRLWSWDRRAGGGAVRVFNRGPFGVAVHQVAFTPEGRYLATANANGTVHLLCVPREGS
jgi:WD40 repeat protein